MLLLLIFLHVEFFFFFGHQIFNLFFLTLGFLWHNLRGLLHTMVMKEFFLWFTSLNQEGLLGLSHVFSTPMGLTG